MGSCFSTHSESSNQLTAKVITINGSLREYSVNVTVDQVLDSETTQSCFLCNSDRLYYDEFIQPLNPKEELEPGQIYFILPPNLLQYRLTASDMAALAVKASLAIGTNNNMRKKNKNKNKESQRTGQSMRISPVLEVNRRFNEGKLNDGMKRIDKKPMVGGITRSGSVRKLQRNASRRAKWAIRSFRFRLSTIQEGSVADKI